MIYECTVWYDVWFLTYWAQQIFLSFCTILCPLTAQKTKISKKWKKSLEMSWFYISAPKIMIIWYTVPEIWYLTDVIVIFHFGLFLALLPPNLHKKWKFQKNKKTPGNIIILHNCTTSHDHMLYCSWGMTHDGCNCYFSFWAIFCPFMLTASDLYQKLWLDDVRFLRYGARQTDRQTDRWTENVTHRCGCPT